MPFKQQHLIGERGHWQPAYLYINILSIDCFIFLTARESNNQRIFIDKMQIRLYSTYVQCTCYLLSTLAI